MGKDTIIYRSTNSILNNGNDNYVNNFEIYRELPYKAQKFVDDSIAFAKIIYGDILVTCQINLLVKIVFYIGCFPATIKEDFLKIAHDADDMMIAPLDNGAYEISFTYKTV